MENITGGSGRNSKLCNMKFPKIKNVNFYFIADKCEILLSRLNCSQNLVLRFLLILVVPFILVQVENRNQIGLVVGTLKMGRLKVRPSLFKGHLSHLQSLSSLWNITHVADTLSASLLLLLCFPLPPFLYSYSLQFCIFFSSSLPLAGALPGECYNPLHISISTWRSA